MRRVFLTGGGGFIGSRLLNALVQKEYSVVALDRSGRIAQLPDPCRVVSGDLLSPETYREALVDVDVVVHLAAATGRASATDHHRINATGTRTLLRESSAAGVQRVLLVSSIAATFPDQRGYPYAQTKTLAESAVRESGIRYAIVRPTMVLGPGSPILAALTRLALLPLIPVFGSGQTPVQPVSVDDVVAVILACLERDLFRNQTTEVGGPETVSIEELLQRIRLARTGRCGTALHVPLGVLLPVLRAAEAARLGRVLPFTVGQLATFRFAGTAERGPLTGLSEQCGATVASMVGPETETGRAVEALERECRVFTRHVIGSDPTPYIVGHYVRAHHVSPNVASGDRFDRYLVRFAARHRLLARLADSYARVFASRSQLRRKLVLLLAILETAPETHRVIDQPPGGGLVLIAGRLVGHGVLWLAGLLAGTVLLGPARLAIGRRKRP